MNEQFAEDRDRTELLVARLADEFTRRLERGDTCDIEEYCRRFPQISDRIREVFPVLALLYENTPISRPDDMQGLLGDYRIIREVGRGGMGIVYEAEQISLKRRVALKVLPFAAVLDQQQLLRFKNEAMAAATLKHPHIVGIYHFGCERAVYYYAMEFIDGQDVGKLIEQLRSQLVGEKTSDENSFQIVIDPSSGQMIASDSPTRIASLSSISNPTEVPAQTPPALDDTAPMRVPHAPTQSLRNKPDYLRTVVRIGIQAAEALHFAHGRGILHRDIKPSNLMLDREGRLTIADFGLARIDGEKNLTLTGGIVGTLRYMSPEQSTVGPAIIDCRTDVYSLGVTLYEMLTLQQFNPTCATLHGQVYAEPVGPRRIDHSIPVDLETIILKSISIDPDDRYSTAQEMADDLRRFSNNEPIHAKRQSLTKQVLKYSQRHKSFVGLLSAMALFAALLSLGVVNIRLGSQSDDSRPKTSSEKTTASIPSRNQVDGNSTGNPISDETIPAPINWPVADAFRDYVPDAPGAVNGNWHYMYSPQGNRDGQYEHYPSYSEEHNAYTATGDWTGSTINAGLMHPGKNNQIPILAWKSPRSGRIHIQGFVEDVDVRLETPPGGIGWFVDLNSSENAPGQLAGGLIENAGPRQEINAFAEIEQGDFLYFGIDPLDNPMNDSTRFDLQINFESVRLPHPPKDQILADSQRDFAVGTGAVNGDWHYMHSRNRKRDGRYSHYSQFDHSLHAFHTSGDWRGSTVTAIKLHPGAEGRMPIVAWKSPVSGIVHVSGFFRDMDSRVESPQGGFGWFVDLNSTSESTGELVSGTSENGGPRQNYSFYLEVRAGDTLYFGVDPLDNPLNDGTAYGIRVSLVSQELTSERVFNAATAP